MVGIVATLLFSALAKDGDPPYAGRSEFGNGSTIAMAWGDADRDGDPDMAVGNYFNQPNSLYFNAAGVFVQQPEFGSRNTFALVWADVDNDGDLDMINYPWEIRLDQLVWIVE